MLNDSQVLGDCGLTVEACWKPPGGRQEPRHRNCSPNQIETQTSYASICTGRNNPSECGWKLGSDLRTVDETGAGQTANEFGSFELEQGGWETEPADPGDYGNLLSLPERIDSGTVLAVKGSLRRAKGAPLTAAGRSRQALIRQGKEANGNEGTALRRSHRGGFRSIPRQVDNKQISAFVSTGHVGIPSKASIPT